MVEVFGIDTQAFYSTGSKQKVHSKILLISTRTKYNYFYIQYNPTSIPDDSYFWF